MNTSTLNAPPLAWTEREAAAQLRVSISWLQHDRIGKRLVPFYRLGSSIRYNPERVKAVLSQLEEGGPPSIRKGR